MLRTVNLPAEGEMPAQAPAPGAAPAPARPPRPAHARARPAAHPRPGRAALSGGTPWPPIPASTPPARRSAWPRRRRSPAASCAAATRTRASPASARSTGAGPDEVSFLDNRRYARALAGDAGGGGGAGPPISPSSCRPGSSAIVDAPALSRLRAHRGAVPSRARARAGHPPDRGGGRPTPRSATGCEIGPYAVIGAGAEIGADCVIGPHAVVGQGVVLGEGCRIGPHASISHCIAGRGVVLHPGARVGQEGFGFAVTPDGRFETMPQLGRVILGDARGDRRQCLRRSRQPGRHRARRRHAARQPGADRPQRAHAARPASIVAQVGISGSATLGDGVQLGGAGGRDRAISRSATAVRVGAQAGVMNDVPAGTDVVGSPAWPAQGDAGGPLRRSASSGRSRRAAERTPTRDAIRKGGSWTPPPAPRHRAASAPTTSRRIMQAIPHRYPFLLVDRVVDIVPNASAVGIKNVTINENFFQGHFPQHPGHARRADHREHGADRGRAGGGDARPDPRRASSSTS